MNDILKFVARQDSDSEKWRKYAGEDVIPAWVADIDCMAAQPIISALQERVAHGVYGYSVPQPALPENVCAYFARRWGWKIKPEWIVYSPGLGASIHNSIRMAEGGGVLTPAPIYHVFRAAPAVGNAQRLDMTMTCEDGDWRLPEEAMQAALKDGNGNARVFQLCNPHNPNGKVYTKDELLAIGEFCCRNDLLIFSDEVHADLILDEDKPHIPIASLSPEIAARTITMQSPSKAYNIAGLNLAFIIISDDDLRARYVAAGAGKILNHLNPFGYVAATAAYSGACDSWLAAMLAHLRENRDILQAAINDIAGVEMKALAATYLAWINVSGLQLEDAPAHFIQHGLGMSPGRDFGDSRHMRLNFGCAGERMREIIRRFIAATNAAGAAA